MVDVSPQYSFTNPQPQVLALPPSLQTHILENVSPKVHAKLIQSCKLFFHLNPLIPICDAYSLGGSLNKALTSSTKDSPSKGLTPLLWVCGKLSLMLFTSSLFNEHFSKVHRITLTELNLQMVTRITYADYLRLTESKTIEKFFYLRASIRYSRSDDYDVPFEAILKELPNVVDFNGSFFTFSGNHEETLSTLPKFLKLKKFDVSSIDKHSDLVDVCTFIKNHPNVEFSFKDIKNRLFKEAIERTAQGIGAIVKL